MVTQELAAHDDMQRIAASESLPRYKSLDVVSNILLKHSEIVHQTSNNLDQNSSPMLYADSAKLLKSYKKELNFKVTLHLNIVWKCKYQFKSTCSNVEFYFPRRCQRGIDWRPRTTYLYLLAFF